MAPEWVFSADVERVAVEHLVMAWVAADAARGSARVAIAGGSAVGAFERASAEVPASVWARTRLTWVDERCVPVASADSNRGAVLRSGALATAPAVTLGLVEDGESVAQSLVRVDAALRDDFADGLDVTLLGIGPDGHIASLFPGRPWGDGRVLHVPDSPKPPPSRLTLTRRLLATAPVHVLMAGGEAKRDALLRLSRADPSLPATGLAGLVIVTDQSGGEPWAT